MLIIDKTKDYKREEVGGKALGLLSLLRMGLSVPDFLVVPAATDITTREFEDELLAKAALIGDKFAIRSSGIMEDTDYNSFAGQYDTVLGVTKGELLDAIKRVRGSYKDAQTYAAKFGRKVSEVAVIVQKQIEPIISGVGFSTSPFDSAKAIVESAAGYGEAVVGGIVTPNLYTFDKGQMPPESLEGEVFALMQTLENRCGYPIDIEWAYDGSLHLLQMRPLTTLPVKIDVNKNYREYVYRDFAFINHYVQACAADESVQKQEFGFHIPVTDCLIVDGHEFYSELNDEIANNAWTELDKGDFFSGFLDDLYRSVRRTKVRVRKLIKTDFSSMSTRGLLAAFRREMRGYLASYVPLMMRPDDYLEGKLSQTLGDRASEVAYAVSYPVKRTYYSQEKYDFLDAAIRFGRGDGSALNEYLDKYEWTVDPLGKGLVGLGRNAVVDRIAELDGSAQSRLSDIQRLRRKNLAKRKKTLNNLSGEGKRIALLLSEFTHMRTLATENSDRYFYYIKKHLLGEIALRCNLPLHNLLLYAPEEIEKLVLNGKKNGEDRRSGVTFVIDNRGFSTYAGNGLALLKKLMPVSSGDLKGSVACSGVACGRVRVIMQSDEADKLRRGEILVTKMTTPSLVIAMERASGIITDEGGVTCHAAIIAREYAVPCLVGVRNATQILQDGMEVELDCIHGICKIVKGEEK